MGPTTHPTAGRFPGNKSGPARPNLGTQCVLTTQRLLVLIAQWVLLPSPTEYTSCGHAGLARQGLKPPPVGKGPGAVLPPILTSASALYQHHTMGLGATPTRPPAPASALLGNGLFLPLLGGGHLRERGHLRQGPAKPIPQREGPGSSGPGSRPPK